MGMDVGTGTTQPPPTTANPNRPSTSPPRGTQPVGSTGFDFYGYGGTVTRPTLNFGAPTQDSSGGSRRSGGGSSGGSTSMNWVASDVSTVNYQFFMPLLGRLATPAEFDMMRRGEWSTYQIEHYITNLPEFKPGAPGYDRLAEQGRQIWEDIIDLGSVLSQAELDSWIKNGWLLSETGKDLARARVRSLPEYEYGKERRQIAWSMNDTWTQRTGQAELTYTARLKRDEILRLAKGDAALADRLWNDWIETTQGYANGTEMAGKKEGVLSILRNLWGWGAVEAMLADNPNLVDGIWKELGYGADPSVIYAWARNHPNYQAGPQAADRREVIRQNYADIMRTAIPEELLNEWVAEGLSDGQIMERLRQTPEYQERYGYKPVWMTEDEWNDQVEAYNSVGRWYFGGADGPFSDFAFSPEQIADFIERGISPTELADHYRWTEDAIADLPTMNYYGAALGKTYTLDDAYIKASGGQGSGQIRAELIQAHARRSFDTSFAILTGRAPTVADYDWLERNFVSPEHYYQTETAMQQAEAVFGRVNELFLRVYGHGADVNKIQDVFLRRPGSGEYEAMMKAAEELDRYTWIWKSYYKTEPTPQDYARLMGYTGPEELLKEITVREQIASKGPEIKNIYNAYWTPLGYDEISDDEIETLIGKYEGWGAVDARLQKAQKRYDTYMESRSMALRWGTSIAPVSYTEFGGPQVPSLRRIAG
jgi:hypothetical protein